MLVEQLIKSTSEMEQLSILTGHLDYLQGKTEEPTMKGEGVFMREPEKDKHPAENKRYITQRDFAINRLNSSIGRRKVANGDFSEFALFAFPRVVRPTIVGGEALNIRKTNFKAPCIRITSENGYYEQSNPFNEALSKAVEEVMAKGEMKVLDSFEFTYIDPKNNAYTYFYNIVAEVDKKTKKYNLGKKSR